MSVSKIVAAAASSAGGATLDVDEVFSTTVYDGTGSTQTITNGIDLSGEGGLVWTKVRDATYDHWLFDTARGAEKELNTNNTGGQGTTSGALQQFNSNGYQLGYSGGAYAELNQSGKDYVSWTWRKAPKWFDVVTYTGNGPTGSSSDTPQTISHNLGSIPALIIVKKTSGSSQWLTFHRSIGSSKYLKLNATSAQTDSTDGGAWATYDPTSTDFKVGFQINDNGATYVAYLFAHNNNDGEFGPSGDQDVIKCGSYTGNGSSTGPVVNLGFEPQWLMIKNASTSRDWLIFDNMRGITTGGNDPFLIANGSAAEENNPRIRLTSTGFQPDEVSSDTNNNGETYIYMAIRRGPLAAPEDATKVFSVQSFAGNNAGANGQVLQTNFAVDMGINRYNIAATGDWDINDRLRGITTNSDNTPYLNPHSTAAENLGGYLSFATNTTITTYGFPSDKTQATFLWKRAPSYFDVVAYTGTGSARTVSHNLSAVPEMMWVKSRTSGGADWNVYTSTTGNGHFLKLNETDASTATSSSHSQWNFTTPTSSVFSLGASSQTNYSGHNYIAYLFATVAGVSKVGSYTGNGSTQNIDCGFSSGARFVLIKKTNSSGGWIVFDSVRGIVSGNDPYLFLNNTNAEGSGYDLLDPYSAGFNIASGDATINASGDNYIFYAIA